MTSPEDPGSDQKKSNESSDPSGFWPWNITGWLPVLVVLPFLVLFFWTTFGRLGVPFELEWNEGQNAELAIRVAENLPLYPDPESGWVPYIYAPGYHQLYGGLMAAFDNRSLPLGRAVSLLAAIGILLLSINWVGHWTQRIDAALVAGFLWLAYFSPSGFFYDLVRNDSLTWFFALLGMTRIFRRERSALHSWIGMFAFLAGIWTKQPVIVFWFLAVLWILFQEGWFSVRQNENDRPKPIAGRLAILASGMIFLNLLVFYPRTGNPEFWRYVVTNAMAHANDLNQLSVPEDVSVPKLFAVMGYSRFAQIGLHPVVWLQPFTLLGIFILIRSRQWSWLVISFLLYGAAVWASASAYLKYGGYNNNWMPLFLATSIVTGLVYGYLMNGFARHRNTIGILTTSIAATLLIIAQTAPFYFNPPDQIPTEEDARAYRNLMIWLEDKAAIDEKVWVLHHQWYGIEAGHPLAYNSDMVRCATYASDWPPQAYYDLIESREFTWIIMNSEDIEYEWLPSGSMKLFHENYVPFMKLPDLAGYEMDNLMPVTGAETRPLMVYRKRTRD